MAGLGLDSGSQLLLLCGEDGDVGGCFDELMGMAYVIDGGSLWGGGSIWRRDREREHCSEGVSRGNEKSHLIIAENGGSVNGRKLRE